MVTKEKISFNRAILVDEKMLRDLHEVLSKYYENIQYSAILKNGASVTFDSLNEMLNYENYRNERIKYLRINLNYSDFLEFSPTVSFCNSFKNTVSGQFTIKNSDEKILIKNQLNTILEKGKQSLFYTLICKISIFYFLITFLALTLLAKLQIILSETIFLKSFEVLLYLSLFLLLVVLFKSLLFSPILFNIGEQIKVNKGKKQLMSNIFWGVIVALFVSIVATLIL